MFTKKRAIGLFVCFCHSLLKMYIADLFLVYFLSEDFTLFGGENLCLGQRAAVKNGIQSLFLLRELALELAYLFTVYHWLDKSGTALTLDRMSSGHYRGSFVHGIGFQICDFFFLLFAQIQALKGKHHWSAHPGWMRRKHARAAAKRKRGHHARARLEKHCRAATSSSTRAKWSIRSGPATHGKRWWRHAAARSRTFLAGPGRAALGKRSGLAEKPKRDNQQSDKNKSIY